MSFTQKMRRALLKESKLEEMEQIAEISRYEAENIMDWFGGDTSLLSFDQLFDGKLRRVINLRSQDAINLQKVVQYLRAEDWSVGELAPWEGGFHSSGNFATKMVKQKRRRLADQGGGEYEEEIEVADLTLSRGRTITIPKGPRAGETIQKVDKTTMSKAIFKNKKIPQELKDWWRNKQVFYSKEGQWNSIEAEFARDPAEEKTDQMSVILSRHPIDVLRMSDHQNIRSCHSEGSGYFHCAQAEAKGHGPIAYLVDDTELQQLLAGLYEEYDTADDPESAYDKDRLQNAAKLKAEDWLKRGVFNLKRHYEMLMDAKDHEESGRIIEIAVDVIFNTLATYKTLSPAVRGVLSDQVVLDAAIQISENGGWPEGIQSISLLDEEEREDLSPESPSARDIGDFDDKEIFKDRDRNIRGVKAKARLRLRRFVDESTDVEFAVPENRIYGASVPGFRDAVRRWSWEAQAQNFQNEDQIPQERYLTRTGGSYEDSTDMEILKPFFAEGGYENAYEGRYGNVHHEHSEEDEDRWQEYEEQCQEYQNWADNNLDHMSVGYDIYGDEQPYVSAWANATINIMLDGWPATGPEETDGSFQPPEGSGLRAIPKSWGSERAWRREFADLLEPENAWPEETDWRVDGQELSIDYSWNCEDCNEPDDFDAFINYLSGDFDANCDEIREKIRRKIVNAGFAAENYFDKFAGVPDDEEDTSDASKFAETLTHFRFIGADVGETSITFSSKNDIGTLSYIATGVSFPRSMWSSSSPTARDVADILGGSVKGFGLEGYVEHTQHASRIIASNLAHLEMEANKSVADQLQFDFGDPKYDKPEDSFGVDLATQARFGTFIVPENEAARLGLPNSEQLHYLGFSLKLEIASADTEKEIKGAITFVKYIDDHMDELNKVMTAIYQEAIDDENNRRTQAKQRKSSDAYKDQQLINLQNSILSAQDVPVNDPAHNPRAASIRAMIMWTKEVWDEMTDVEKRVLMQYAGNLLRGERVFPDHADPKLPDRWIDNVKQMLTAEEGAPGAVANQYSPSFSASYAKLLHFWTNPHHERFDNLERIELMRDRVEDDFVPMPVVFESMKESVSYFQSEYEIICGVAMAKDLGGTVEQTLKDIRAVEAVTIVDTVEGTAHDTDVSHNVDLTIKFVRNQRSKPYRFIRFELVPQLRAVKGLSGIRVKSIRKTGA
mgnify:CR=1 FL=1